MPNNWTSAWAAPACAALVAISWILAIDRVGATDIIGPGTAVVVRVGATRAVVLVGGALEAGRSFSLVLMAPLAVVLELPPGRAVCSRSRCCSRAPTLAFSPVWSKPRSRHSLTMTALVAQLRTVCSRRRKALAFVSVAISSEDITRSGRSGR